MADRVYTPESPIRRPLRLFAAMARDLVASRELAWRLFVRDFSAQYRQSALGYLWAIAPPVVTALPWLFLSSQGILTSGQTPVPYVAYVLVGTTLWTIFSDSLLLPSNALNAGKTMLTKIDFRREALILGAMGQLATNGAIRLTLMFLVLTYVNVQIGRAHV